MFEEFRSYIREHDLFRYGDKVLLAVSGGIDSMVMAHLFLMLGKSTGIAHCNFCLRGTESDRDEELVKSFADKHGIPFYSIRFNTKEYAVNNRISVQMAARELRYGWFENIRVENHYDYVAVAHNLNDNIETLLINLIRGTGITGLSGMRPADNRIIRPLLFATRRKIEDYCIDNQIQFREDKSNTETKYIRNKIRHQVIPVLKEINPSVEKSLAQTAGKLAGTDEILTEYVDEIRANMSVKRDKTVIFDVAKLSGLKAGKSLIFEIFNPYGINGSTSGDLMRLLSGSTGKQIFTRTHRIIRNRDELIISPLETVRRDDIIITVPEDLCKSTVIKSATVIANSPDFTIPADKNIICLDFEKIIFPVQIRGWKKGDFFYPLGMKHPKKLSDYFIDRKLSLVEKEKVLILQSEGSIVGILGERIDDRYRVTESTSKILVIHLLPGHLDKGQPER